VSASSDDPASHARVLLPATPQSAAASRRFIARILAGWDLTSLRDTAILLGNELVTNALRHARSAVEVELTRRASTLRIAIHDATVTPPVRRFNGPEASSGRGLAMVEALAAGWGVLPRPPAGKTVWFELRVPHATGFDRSLTNGSLLPVSPSKDPGFPAGAGAGTAC
jgi:anti-sigma regulatory factor (Ser/Thr protein kinase)